MYVFHEERLNCNINYKKSPKFQKCNIKSPIFVPLIKSLLTLGFLTEEHVSKF